VLDKYMRDYILKRGGHEKQIHIVPVWPVMQNRYEGNRYENPFRIAHDFGDRIVVMYSGNHSYIHPLDTFLETILHFKYDPDFVFVFIGDGVRKKDVSHFIERHQLGNVIQLPYQPRNNIHHSLGSSDIQVVIMGESQVGYTHPNKIYGAMFMGKPVLYIGPDESHVTDILRGIEGNILVGHNQAAELVEKLRSFKADAENHIINTGSRNRSKVTSDFDPLILKTEMVRILTSA
jgi:colanic acid biosynthesis glycosyl transferase WcaI